MAIRQGKFRTRAALDAAASLAEEAGGLIRKPERGRADPKALIWKG
jgi:hypothetical protein